MQIKVDRNRCEGYGFCEERAPQLVQLDEDGELMILADPQSVSAIESARQAVRSCPVAALVLGE